MRVPLTSLQTRILTTLRENGPMTDSALTRTIRGYGPSTVRSRRAELAAVGKVRPVASVLNRRGYPETVWEAARSPRTKQTRSAKA